MKDRAPNALVVGLLVVMIGLLGTAAFFQWRNRAATVGGISVPRRMAANDLERMGLVPPEPPPRYRSPSPLDPHIAGPRPPIIWRDEPNELVSQSRRIEKKLDRLIELIEREWPAPALCDHAETAP